MAQLARSELHRAEASPDVAELIDSARLRKRHASSTHDIFFGAAQIGRLVSTVSGGQRDGQLLYTVKGELGHPFAASLKGYVMADWERHPERFVLELTWAGERHRLEGQFTAGDANSPPTFSAEYVPPGEAAKKRAVKVPLETRVQLAPGPLPLPALSLPPGATSRGVTDASLLGQPMSWSLQSLEEELSLGAGSAESTLKHQLSFGAFEASLWVDAEGLPLQIELPFGLMLRRAVDADAEAAP